MVRVDHPITGRVEVQFPLKKRLVKLTAGGVSVHLLVMAEVPLSKAPYRHSEWVKGRGQILCLTVCMTINLILILIL